MFQLVEQVGEPKPTEIGKNIFIDFNGLRAGHRVSILQSCKTGLTLGTDEQRRRKERRHLDATQQLTGLSSGAFPKRKTNNKPEKLKHLELELLDVKCKPKQ